MLKLTSKQSTYTKSFTHSPTPRRSVRLAANSSQCEQETQTGNVSEESRRHVLGLAASAVAIAAIFPAQPAAALPGFKKDLTSKRRIVIPESDYSNGPQGLKYYDIVVGTGPEAKEGQRVAVHYDVKWRGITFATTRQGMGVTGGSPFGFDVGAKPGQGGTLKGLDLGVRGMRVGGQRRLLVPPQLAYGSKGYGEVPGDATLTMDVALLSIKKDAIGYRVKLVEG